MKKLHYSLGLFEEDVKVLVEKLKPSVHLWTGIFGVPRGGIPLAIALSGHLDIPLIDDPFGEQDRGGIPLVVDDVVDSGATRERYQDFDFASIHIKPHVPSDLVPQFYAQSTSDWIVYFWEKGPTGEEQSGQDAVTRQLEYIGEDPGREGLKETPGRVTRAWGEIFSGYDVDPATLVKTFEAGSYDQMILVKNIEMFSMCEHHLLPFFGKAHVAYIPNKRVIGLSKLARILDVYARRCQIQERIGEQVTSLLMKELNCIGAACIIEAEHLCMRMRGVNKQESIATTSSLKGRFLEDSDQGRASRAELMGLIR